MNPLPIGTWGQWPYYELHDCRKLVRLDFDAKEKRTHAMLPQEVFERLKTDYVTTITTGQSIDAKFVERVEEIFTKYKQ